MYIYICIFITRDAKPRIWQDACRFNVVLCSWTADTETEVLRAEMHFMLIACAEPESMLHNQFFLSNKLHVKRLEFAFPEICQQRIYAINFLGCVINTHISLVFKTRCMWKIIIFRCIAYCSNLQEKQIFCILNLKVSIRFNMYLIFEMDIALILSFTLY